LSHNKIFGEIYDRGARAGFSESPKREATQFPSPSAPSPPGLWLRTWAQNFTTNYFIRRFIVAISCLPKVSRLGSTNRTWGTARLFRAAKYFI